MKSYAPIPTDYVDMFEDLSDENFGKLMRWCLIYYRSGEDIELPAEITLLKKVCRVGLDRALESYEAKCEANRANGAKGGRPRKTQKTQPNPNNPVGFEETQITQANPKNPVGFKKPKKPTQTEKTQPNPNNPNRIEENRIDKNRIDYTDNQDITDQESIDTLSSISNQNNLSNNQSNLSNKENIREESKEEKQEKDTDTRACVCSSKKQERFDRFWTLYPKKVGKQAAWKTWSKLNPSEELTEKILSAVETQKGWKQWKKEDGRFIPNPTTWLNQGRWDDEGMGGELNGRNAESESGKVRWTGSGGVEIGTGSF